MFKEFKEFVTRGNVVDLAVGIIIGAAFTTIVNSFVNDILMPPLGLLLGGIDFSNFFIQLTGDATYSTLEAARAEGAVVIAYGSFINAITHFLIVGFAIFILVKQVNRFRREKPEEPAPVVRKPEEILLEEIRDLLREGNSR